MTVVFPDAVFSPLVILWSTYNFPLAGYTRNTSYKSLPSQAIKPRPFSTVRLLILRYRGNLRRERRYFESVPKLPDPCGLSKGESLPKRAKTADFRISLNGEPHDSSLPKAPTGIKGLDEISGGGLPRARTTIVCGGPGCGKTMLGMEFLIRGAREFDEPGVLVAFEETPQEMERNVDLSWVRSTRPGRPQETIP